MLGSSASILSLSDVSTLCWIDQLSKRALSLFRWKWKPLSPSGKGNRLLARVSQLRHYWYFEPDSSLLWEVLCALGMFSSIPGVHLTQGVCRTTTLPPEMSPDGVKCTLEDKITSSCSSPIHKNRKFSKHRDGKSPKDTEECRFLKWPSPLYSSCLPPPCSKISELPSFTLNLEWELKAGRKVTYRIKYRSFCQRENNVVTVTSKSHPFGLPGDCEQCQPGQKGIGDQPSYSSRLPQSTRWRSSEEKSLGDKREVGTLSNYFRHLSINKHFHQWLKKSFKGGNLENKQP